MNWVLDFRSLGPSQAVNVTSGASGAVGYCEQGDPRIRTKELRRVSQKNQVQPGEPGATRRARSYQDQYQDQLIITLA